MPDIGPAPVLSVVVGVFHTALFVVIRGTGGGRLILMALAAILGAYAGQALGMRIGDPTRMGDFPLLSASVLAWAGILLIAVASTLGPQRQRTS